MTSPTVQHPNGTATLTDGVWTSENPSLALWLNSVAESVEDACAYGCTTASAAPVARAPIAPAPVDAA